jgi:hypothetical protein
MNASLGTRGSCREGRRPPSITSAPFIPHQVVAAEAVHVVRADVAGLENMSALVDINTLATMTVNRLTGFT